MFVDLKYLNFLIYFTLLVSFTTQSYSKPLSQKQERSLASIAAQFGAPDFTCSFGNLDACHKCEIQARGQSITPKQVSEIYNKLNVYNQNSDGDETKKIIDQTLRAKVARYKIEAMYDIATNGIYSWPNLSNWPELSEKLMLNNKCFPEEKTRNYYAASKLAAESMIKQKTKQQKEAEQLEILKTRIKTVFETRQKLNELAKLRTRVARDELPFKDKSKIEENKKLITKLEREFINENYLLKAPELFRALSMSDLSLNSIKQNRSVGAFAPNALYEKIEKLFNDQFTELEYPSSQFALETAGPTVKSDINDYKTISENTLTQFLEKNSQELLKELKKQYADTFMQLHRDINAACGDVSDYYKNKRLVMEAASEVLKNNNITRDQVLGGYKKLCEVVNAKQNSEENWSLVESSINNSSAAKAAGLIGILVPVGGWVYAKVGETALGGIFLASNLARAQKLVQAGRAIRWGSEGAGLIYTGSVITAASTGYASNTYDVELKNLFLLIQEAKKQNPTEIEKLKAEIAELTIKTGESQSKLSDTGLKGMQGIFLAGTTYFSITQVLREIQDAKALLQIKATLDAWRAGKLKEEEFLEQVYRIKTRNFKPEINKEEYQAWLEATKLKNHLENKEIAQVTKDSAKAVFELRKDLETFKNLSAKEVDDISLLLYKFEDQSIKAVGSLLQRAKSDPKELSEIKKVIIASSTNPAKQKYIHEFTHNGRLLRSDIALLKNWSDPVAINLIINIRKRASYLAITDKSLKGDLQKALDKALKEDLGVQGYYNLCIKGGCPACVVK